MNKTRLLFIVPALLISLPLLLVLASSRERPAWLDGFRLPTAEGAPRAVVDEPVFDFGVMDPLTEQSHVFVIRNEGVGPLKLESGSTTCKCTLSRLTQREIAPGEAGQVVLTWNTGSKDPTYEHNATILTNDPRRAELQLTVKGTVRVQLGAVPAELHLSGVEPDRSATATTFIYSQIGAPFSVAGASCSLAETEVIVGEAPASVLEQLQAKCGYQLTLRLPSGLLQGTHQEVIQVAVRREGAEETETLEVPVAVEVLRRLAVYGPGIDMTGTIELGALPSGKGVRRRFVMKVRDEMRELNIREIVTEPAWLRVEISPYPTKSTSGLYHLDVEVPADAPACVYMGPELGRIRLDIDHPRIPDLTLQVRLAVKRPE